MDKNEGLEKISLLMENVKEIKPFKGKLALVRKLGRLYDMIHRYKPITNYNALCVEEARRLVEQKMSEIGFYKDKGVNNHEE